MSLPLVFHPDYSPPLPAGHRFPMLKYRLLHEHLRETLPEARYHTPEDAGLDCIALAHERSYIERFLAGALSPREERQLGLPWSEALVRRTLRAVGGSLLTAELALRHGLACNLAGGTHHAHWAHPAGFCVFNDLAVMARTLQARGEASRILILDCDVHQGDGTARILAEEPELITVSLHGADNFPFDKACSDWDLPLASGTGDAEYLRQLDGLLSYLLALYQPDLVLYDGGVDVHAEDALGKLALSDAGIAARDWHVFEQCLGRDIPVACVIGGGYHPDHARLARRHAILEHTAMQAWRAFGLS